MSLFIVRPTAARPGRPVANVLDVFAFGFGAAAPGQSYPAIYIAGYVNNVYGIWQSTNNAQSWTNIGTFPLGETNPITTISGDPNEFGEVYIGFHGGGYAYLSATSTTGPTVTAVTDSPATGDLNAGKTVALTLSFSESVTVAGGTPTLTLNDGGTATYASGSGTSALTFNYTVAAGQKRALPRRYRPQPADRRHHRGQLWQRRQPVALRPHPERAADRHHNPRRQLRSPIRRRAAISMRARPSP